MTADAPDSSLPRTAISTVGGALAIAAAIVAFLALIDPALGIPTWSPLLLAGGRVRDAGR